MLRITLLTASTVLALSACHAPKAHVATSSTAAIAQTDTHPPAPDRSIISHAGCAAGDGVIFSCELRGHRRVSLCLVHGAGPEAAFYLRDGTQAVPTNDKPAPATIPTSQLRRTFLGFAGNSGGYVYSFAADGKKHLLYSISGSEGLEDQGYIRTEPGTGTVDAAMPCVTGSVVEDEGERVAAMVSGLAEDKDIARHGLPAKREAGK